jgi:DNA modification methylase
MPEPWRNRIIGHGEEAPDQLLANPRNFRIHPKGQQDALLGVMREVGIVDDVIVNKATGFVVDGHLRVALAISERQPTIPVKYVDLTEQEETLILATFDPISAMAASDKGQLDVLLRDVQSGEAAVQAMLGELAKASGLDYGKEPKEAPEPQSDKAAELQAKWGTQKGQVWELGQHRIACGDSTDAAHIARLMGGAKADCMWTDPPYGVEYVGKTKDALTIENDGADGLDALLQGLFAVADSVLVDGAAIYIAHPAGALSVTFGHRFLAQGWRLHETLVWVKDSMVLGHADYHYKHEPILYGYKPGNGRRGRGGQGWYGGNDQVSVFEVPRPKRSEAHPTMKPPELVRPMLQNSCPAGGLVYEPCCGSGSTMVAAEQLGMWCFASELSPAYCAVVLERLAAMGLAPRLANG